MATDVVVVGVGMMTPVGLSAAETAASIRAGTSRFSESHLRDKRFAPFKIAEVPEEGIPALVDAESQRGLSAREERMLRLATAPLQEALAPLQRRARVGLCLSLPEQETTRPLNRHAFLRHLAAQTNGAFRAELSDSTHIGRAGGLIAIGQATTMIQQGLSGFMVAGGVETYRDLYVLGTLDHERRVKSALNLDGFIPGEAAAFLLLASPDAAASHGLVPIVTVSSVAVGYEPGHLYSNEPYRGEGLAATVSQLISTGSISAPIAEVFSSMNGENYWAKEWGVSFIRSRAIFDQSHGMHHPADSFGDAGAAVGALLVGLAAEGIKASYRRSPALVYGSSDRGTRAALVVADARH